MPRGLRYCLLQTAITQHPRANPTQAPRKLKTERGVEFTKLEGEVATLVQLAPGPVQYSSTPPPVILRGGQMLLLEPGNQAKDSHLKSRARTEVLKEQFTHKMRIQHLRSSSIKTHVTLS